VPRKKEKVQAKPKGEVPSVDSVSAPPATEPEVIAQESHDGAYLRPAPSRYPMPTDERKKENDWRHLKQLIASIAGVSALIYLNFRKKDLLYMLTGRSNHRPKNH
jgi:hypothetical protein